MKKLLLVGVTLSALTACGGGAPTPPPYSPVGTWVVVVKPDAANSQRTVGKIVFTLQEANGGLSGNFYTSEGTLAGDVAGNSRTGKVGVIFVDRSGILDMTGTFNGRQYAGTYIAQSLTSTDRATGSVTMARQ